MDLRRGINPAVDHVVKVCVICVKKVIGRQIDWPGEIVSAPGKLIWQHVMASGLGAQEVF